VAGQATKNSLYLMNPARLRQELEDPAVDEPATWTNGKRANDRDDGGRSRETFAPAALAVIGDLTTWAGRKETRDRTRDYQPLSA